MRIVATLVWSLMYGAVQTLGRSISSPTNSLQKRWFPIKPKVFLFSRMYAAEDVWSGPLGLTENVTVTGLSTLFPNVTCNQELTVCHMITNEGEVNAASSSMALLLSEYFDLRKTYFLIGGVAGVNPYFGTTGAVGFARWAVQVSLAYEIDARQIPANWTTGFWLYNTLEPGQVATEIYGTELYELNTNLRAKVFEYTKGVKLNDSADAQAYRDNYDYAPANQPPQIIYGDVATTDVYWAGNLIAEAVGNITKLWTNGTGEYVFDAQEDNATFEPMVRLHNVKIDFSRVILMRTGSDFDRQPPNQTAYDSFEGAQNGYPLALTNIFTAGYPIVQGILKDWDSTFAQGIAPPDEWYHNGNVCHTFEDLRSNSTQARRRKRAYNPCE